MCGLYLRKLVGSLPQIRPCIAGASSISPGMQKAFTHISSRFRIFDPGSPARTQDPNPRRKLESFLKPSSCRALIPMPKGHEEVEHAPIKHHRTSGERVSTHRCLPRCRSSGHILLLTMPERSLLAHMNFRLCWDPAKSDMQCTKSISTSSCSLRRPSQIQVGVAAFAGTFRKAQQPW